MSLPPKDLEIVVKMLNLTMSDSDHEALSAIRKANAVLKRNNLGWAAVLEIDLFDNAKPSTGPEHPKEERARKINEMFEEVIPRAFGEDLRVLLELKRSWRDKKTLSPSQYAILVKAKMFL